MTATPKKLILLFVASACLLCCAAEAYGLNVLKPDDFAEYDVFVLGSDEFIGFGDMAGALGLARGVPSSFIYHWPTGRLLWDNSAALPGSASAVADALLQMPELPRGCEVTSLAMLLQSQGVPADKMDLAERVKKVPASYRGNGMAFNGDPNDGFVGSIYDFKAPGYGVYHEPIADLLNICTQGMALDLTGCNFNDLLYYLALGIPVWVITNTTFAPLPNSAFVTWQTAAGPLDITYREHSVLLTGYDEAYAYFNDPLAGENAARIGSFAGAWEQMGRQAVTVMP